MSYTGSYFSIFRPPSTSYPVPWWLWGSSLSRNHSSPRHGAGRRSRGGWIHTSRWSSRIAYPCPTQAPPEPRRLVSCLDQLVPIIKHYIMYMYILHTCWCVEETFRILTVSTLKMKVFTHFMTLVLHTLNL